MYAWPGIRSLEIIDLSRIFGGPFCTQCLGDRGAKMIKIELPQGDATDLWGLSFGKGTTLYFEAVNPNNGRLDALVARGSSSRRPRAKLKEC